jgi:hypothetical protein
MIQKIVTIAALLISTTLVFSQNKKDLAGDCEDCDAMFAGMPATINSETRLSPSGEKGEPLILT